MVGTSLGALRRSTQAYGAQLSEIESLDWGVAYTGARWAGLYEANQFRDFMVPTESDAAAAYAAVECHFADRGLTCFRWTAGAHQPYEAMGQFLCAKGYRRRDLLACALAQWRDLSVRRDVRILPARPMRRQYQETFLDPGGVDALEYQVLCAEAALERLDHSSYEAQVAMLAGRPVGRCALFQVGDIARVIDLYVRSEYRRQGVGTALLVHGLGLARRFMARTICLEVEADNIPAGRCVERLGFVPDGKLVEFHHPAVVLAEYPES